MSIAKSVPKPNVLMFGRNGRVSRAMMRIMVARSWQVTSVVRNIEQKQDILSLGEHNPATCLDVLECDLQNIRSSNEAFHILEKIRPNIVVFAAGTYFGHSLVRFNKHNHLLKLLVVQALSRTLTRLIVILHNASSVGVVAGPFPTAR